MVRIDLFLFGYRRFKVKEADAAEIASVLLSLGITSGVSPDGILLIREADYKKLRAELDGIIDYEISELMGLPGFICENKRKYGAILGIALAVCLFFYSSGAVFDVRLYGDTEALSEARELLSELGLSPGSRWSRLDRDRLEAEVLQRSDSVGWININRRGTVAYVTVKGKNTSDENNTVKGYSNVVADRDCIIEELTVRSGYPLVKEGDSVKAGDVLISGIIPGELGGGFVEASGYAIGRAYETFSTEISREYTEKKYISYENLGYKIKILDFSLNLLKKGRNLSSSCDIIIDKSSISLPDGRGLPLSVTSETLYRYETVTRSRTDAELVLRCGELMRKTVSDALKDAELLSLRTDGEYTEFGYTMTTFVTALYSVGEVRTIGEENE